MHLKRRNDEKLKQVEDKFINSIKQVEEKIDTSFSKLNNDHKLLSTIEDSKQTRSKIDCINGKIEQNKIKIDTIDKESKQSEDKIKSLNEGVEQNRIKIDEESKHYTDRIN